MKGRGVLFVVVVCLLLLAGGCKKKKKNKGSYWVWTGPTEQIENLLPSWLQGYDMVGGLWCQPEPPGAGEGPHTGCGGDFAQETIDGVVCGDPAPNNPLEIDWHTEVSCP